MFHWHLSFASVGKGAGSSASAAVRDTVAAPATSREAASSAISTANLRALRHASTCLLHSALQTDRRADQATGKINRRAGQGKTGT